VPYGFRESNENSLRISHSIHGLGYRRSEEKSMESARNQLKEVVLKSGNMVSTARAWGGDPWCQYSVFMTGSRRGALAAERIARHYGASVMVFKGEQVVFESHANV